VPKGVAQCKICEITTGAPHGWKTLRLKNDEIRNSLETSINIVLES
jgi:very-short-patch-repair endonuclease